MRRFLTAAAAGSTLLAVVVPAAHAADLAGTLHGAARTAGAAGAEAAPADGVLGDKVGAVEGVVRAGADAVESGNDLVN